MPFALILSWMVFLLADHTTGNSSMLEKPAFILLQPSKKPMNCHYRSYNMALRRVLRYTIAYPFSDTSIFRSRAENIATDPRRRSKIQNKLKKLKLKR